MFDRIFLSRQPITDYYHSSWAFPLREPQTWQPACKACRLA
jgi:hypothetical protein